MRSLVILILLAGNASADNVAPLPTPADHPPSKRAQDDARKIQTSCTIDQKGCLASWVRAATIDPSNIDVRAQLADYYYRQGDKTTALAIMAQLKELACRECLATIVKPHDWKDDTAFADRVKKGVHGRHSKYSKAASIVIAALTKSDWSKLAPFMPPRGNIGLPPSTSDVGDRAESIADVKRWLDNGHADVRASGLTTCEDDCCYEIWDTFGGDTPSYLMGMCFVPGPVLRETIWGS